MQGYDTAVRLLHPQYYGDESGMLLQFAALRMRGCSFLVAGRREESGAFMTLDDMTVPEALQVLLSSIHLGSSMLALLRAKSVAGLCTSM